MTREGVTVRDHLRNGPSEVRPIGSATVDAMRRRGVEDRELARLDVVLRVRDPHVLRDVRALGFTADTVALLFLVPVVHVAWLEGGLTAPERRAIEAMGHRAGITSDTAAGRWLAAWLTAPPPPSFVQDATAVLRRVLDALPAGRGEPLRERVLEACGRVARTTGGIAGWFAVSKDERRFLDQLARSL